MSSGRKQYHNILEFITATRLTPKNISRISKKMTGNEQHDWSEYKTFFQRLLTERKLVKKTINKALEKQKRAARNYPISSFKYSQNYQDN